MTQLIMMQSRLIIFVLSILVIALLSCPYTAPVSTKGLIRQVQLILHYMVPSNWNKNLTPQIFSPVKAFTANDYRPKQEMDSNNSHSLLKLNWN